MTALEWEDDTAPAFSQAAYDASPVGKARRRKYRHESNWQTDATYLSKPFIGWDGEGITKPNGDHVYVLLANSLGSHIEDPNGLPMWRCLQFMLAEAGRNPGIHVAYGAGYDINMILKGGLTRSELWSIYQNRYADLHGFRLSWRRGKSLWVRAGDTSMTLFDCAPFFQVPFINACDDYLGDRFHERDLIVRNKALRSGFTLEDLPEVLRYNTAELVNLVNLMDELRERLNKVGLRPRRWDGPGAVASALLQREGIKKAMAPSPPPVAEAARFAYAGGRFEVIRYGSVEGPVYEYDLNSAYPSALRHVPNLARGQWLWYDHDPGPKPYALYHIDYRDPKDHIDIPGPLFCRRANGTVAYPTQLVGWYWSPEYDALKVYHRKFDSGQVTKILGAWVFEEDDPDDRPFAFVERLYAKRRALKKGGDGAHTGIKLGLNSLYG